MSNFTAYPGVPHWQTVFDVDFKAAPTSAAYQVPGAAAIAGYNWTTVGVGNGTYIRAIKNVNGVGLTFQFSATNGSMNGCYGVIGGSNNVQLALPLPSVSNLITMAMPLRVRVQLAPCADWHWYSENSECGFNVALCYRRTTNYSDMVGHYAQHVRHWTNGGGLVEWTRAHVQKLNAAESSHTYLPQTTAGLIASSIAGFELPFGLQDSTYRMAYGNPAYSEPWVNEGSLLVPLAKYGTTYGATILPVAALVGYNDPANWRLEISSEATFNAANSMNTHIIVLRSLRVDAWI